MYEVQNVSYRVKSKTIVDKINFKAELGKMTVIAGKNGAGKSTLLKILTNEITPSMGRVSLFGKDIPEFSALELAQVRSVLPQEQKVAFSLSANAVLELGRVFFDENSAQKQRLKKHVIALMLSGKEALLDQKFGALSGGEKQRVQLARVLYQILDYEETPKFIILDEPVAGLDIQIQKELLDTIRQIVMDAGVGVIMVLHDINLIYEYADVVYFMKEGEVCSSGCKEEKFTIESLSDVYDTSLSEYSNAEGVTRFFY